MAEIKNLLGFRHYRAEPSAFVLHHRRGRLVRKGRGLSFWFWPLSASILQIPMDDRELPFHFHGRSSQYQEVNVQGVVTYRVVDPIVVSQRMDFSVDLMSARYLREPLQQLSLMITQLAQQFAWDYVATNTLESSMSRGPEEIRERVFEGLSHDQSLRGIGIEVVAVRISAVQPTSELERALQLPTMEQIQERADEATFRRRAQAVEKERAIQENELQTQLELAKREEKLIEQRGLNMKRQASEEAAADRITTESHAANRRIHADAEADSIRSVEEAKVGAERSRMEIYQGMPPTVMMGLAARELAAKLQKIEHLSIAPEMLGPLLTNLVQAGTRRLEEPADE